MDQSSAPAERDAWKDANSQGLVCARTGDWPAAADAFERARAMLATAGEAGVI